MKQADGGVRGYRDLIVWQKAMDLVVECYLLIEKFPQSERFGLASQLQRSAVSVPANIAEGQGRGSTKAFINHLWIANGSLTESETHLMIAHRLEYISQADLDQLLQRTNEIGRMLVGLRRSLTKRNQP